MQTDFGYTEDERHMFHKASLTEIQHRANFAVDLFKQAIQDIDKNFAESTLQVAMATGNAGDFEESLHLFQKLKGEQIEALEFRKMLEKHHLAEASVERCN